VKGRVRSLGHRRFINKTDLGLKYWSYNYFFSSSEGGGSKKSDKCDIRSGAQGEFKGLVGRRERENTAGRGVGGERQKAGQRGCVMLGTVPVYTVQTVKEKKKRAKG